MVYDNDCKYNLFKCKLTKKEERVPEPDDSEESVEDDSSELNESGLYYSYVVIMDRERMTKQFSKIGLISSSPREHNEESGL